MALVVAHRHVVSTSFEGAALLACNGLPPPSCRGGSQEHVRVAWMSGGVLRWQGACARCVGFRQLRVGGRCYRKPPPTAVARVWSGQPKSSIINVRAIGERALRWVLQAVTKTGSRGTPTFHRPARTTGSDGLSVTPQLRVYSTGNPIWCVLYCSTCNDAQCVQPGPQSWNDQYLIAIALSTFIRHALRAIRAQRPRRARHPACLLAGGAYAVHWPLLAGVRRPFAPRPCRTWRPTALLLRRQQGAPPFLARSAAT